MCDACPKTSHVPIYTISLFTGERLCLCLDCADNNAEPLKTILHGVNNGALDKLPHSIKRQLTVPTKDGRYISMRRCARLLDRKIKMLPPPDPWAEEVVATEVRLVRMMKNVQQTYQPEPRSLTLSLANRLRKLFGRVFSLPSGRNGRNVPAVV